MTTNDIAGLSPGALAWKRFRRNPLAVAGSVFLLLCVLAGMFAYPLAPDSTHNANFQVLELARKPPGTVAHILLRPRTAGASSPGFFSFLAYGKSDPGEPIPLLSADSIAFFADSVSWLHVSGYRDAAPLAFFIEGLDRSRKMPGSAQAWRFESGTLTYHDISGAEKKIEAETLRQTLRSSLVLKRTFWLGTDGYGRDVLSRLLIGTRVSLSVGFLAVIISLLVGVFLGSVAGFFGGRVDAAVMWFTSVIWSIPTLLLAISLTFVWEKGFWQIFIAIGLSMWVEVARMVRGQILQVKEMQYVEAAAALGYSDSRTILVHILPNILNPVIIIAAANFASAILVEAGLSFLGVGVQPPVPSWGGMIREGYTYIIFESGKWLAVFPGLAIVLVVISLNLVGFGLRDALDPKMKGK